MTIGKVRKKTCDIGQMCQNNNGDKRMVELLVLINDWLHEMGQLRQF